VSTIWCHSLQGWPKKLVPAVLPDVRFEREALDRLAPEEPDVPDDVVERVRTTGSGS
jgi:hypothetical protein